MSVFRRIPILIFCLTDLATTVQNYNDGDEMLLMGKWLSLGLMFCLYLACTFIIFPKSDNFRRRNSI